MNKKFTVVLSLLLIFSFSCSFITGLVPNSGTNNPAAQPLTASGNGPAGLTAQATSADSVKLTWQAVDGAIAYRLWSSTNGSESMAFMDLPASATSYTDFIAMPNSQLTYAVEAVGESGSIGQSVVDVSTPARQPNPLKVQAKFDDNTSVTQTIGPDGGSVSLKDAKGVKYKFDIPSGALSNPTDVKLTAINKIDGWPLDGNMLGGVKIEPEGLQLNDVATLSITLPDGLSSDKLSTLGFAFSGTGDEFHLQPAYKQNAGTGLVPGNSGGGHLASPVRQNLQSIVEETLWMYGIGVGQGSADSAGKLAKNNPPTDASAAMDQKQAIISAESDDLFPLPNLPKPTANQYDADASITASAVSLLISAAGDCGALHSAMVSFQLWRSRADFNKRGALHPDQIDATEKQIMDKLADKVKETMDKVVEDCKKSKGQEKTAAAAQVGCLQSILDKIANPPTTPSNFWNELQSKMLNKFGDHVVADADTELQKCPKQFAVNAAVPSGSIEGVICDLNASFTLTMTGDVNGTMTFTPQSSTSGTLSESAAGGGVTFDGGGSYQISGIDSNAPMMKIEFAETSHTPMGDFAHNETANLPMFSIRPGDVDQCP